MMARMGFYLGVDAGGTRTQAALADEHATLALAASGSIKTMRVPPEQAEQNLRSLLAELTAKSGIPIEAVTSACVGIAGSTVSTVNGWVWNTLGPLLRGDLDVCGDTEIALDAAFPGGPGVLVIAGTGSNILGRSSNGTLLHVGGWGPVLGDEGSGYWIGHQALRAALRASDRNTAVPLLRAISAEWKIDVIERLIEVAHATPPPDFAALVPLVVATAAAGDQLARDILTCGGELLAEDAVTALDKVRALDPGGEDRLAFTGSVLRHATSVREAMLAAVRRDRPLVEVVPEPVDPVAGALWRARHLAGEHA